MKPWILVPSVLIVFGLRCYCSAGWIVSFPHSYPRLSIRSLQRHQTRFTTQLFEQELPSDYQEEGEAKILEAATSVGAKKSQINVTWDDSKITVTVSGDTFAGEFDDGGLDGEGADVDEEANGETETIDGTDLAEALLDGGNQAISGVDITTIARAINAALSQDELGEAIAKRHSIEVTTPGVPDELDGIMWEVYKGFEVIAEFKDPKAKTAKKQQKRIEGRLLEKNEECTVINLKGRMKKIKNEHVISVRLQKSKKEKGGRR